MSRTSMSILVLTVAAFGAVTIGWQAASPGQQNVESALRPPGRRGAGATDQDVGGGGPPEKPPAPDPVAANLKTAKAALEEMMSMIAPRVKADAQAIVKALDRDGASSDLSLAVVRRAEALKILVKKLK